MKTDILNANEASEMLRVSPQTLTKWSRDGSIPHRRVGKQYRYSRRSLEEWMAGSDAKGQHHGSKEKLPGDSVQTGEDMALPDIHQGPRQVETHYRRSKPPKSNSESTETIRPGSVAEQLAREFADIRESRREGDSAA